MLCDELCVSHFHSSWVSPHTSIPVFSSVKLVAIFLLPFLLAQFHIKIVGSPELHGVAEKKDRICVCVRVCFPFSSYQDELMCGWWLVRRIFVKNSCNPGKRDTKGGKGKNSVFVEEFFFLPGI